MRVCVLYPHTNFEVLRPYRSEDMAYFVPALVGLWPWPLIFDLETGTQCSTCHGVPCSQFWWYNTLFSIYGPLCQHGSDWHETLMFDLGGHIAMLVVVHSSSIRIPSLKFVGLAIRKIRRTMCVTINRSGDPDLLTLKLVCESHLRWGTFLQILAR